jgi:hypothetical protein
MLDSFLHGVRDSGAPLPPRADLAAAPGELPDEGEPPEPFVPPPVELVR